jgi:hypothetical protein
LSFGCALESARPTLCPIYASRLMPRMRIRKLRLILIAA